MSDPYARQWEFLVKSASEEKLFNAYLFYGPEDVDAIAKDFLLSANFLDKDFSYLLEKKFLNDERAKQILATNLLMVDPLLEDDKGNEKAGKEITIGQVKQLTNFASLTSLNNGYKAVIIRQAHCLNSEAQNAFLKILEEPKGNVFFILATQHPDRLLPTVLSRCSRVFFPFSEQEKNLPSKHEEFKKLCLANFAKRFAYSNEILKIEEKAEKYSTIKKEIEDWVSYFRLMMLEALGIEFKFTQKINPKNYSLKDIGRILNRLQETYYLLENTNVNQKLNIENFLIEL